jgi:ankyrin repeat protein
MNKKNFRFVIRSAAMLIAVPIVCNVCIFMLDLQLIGMATEGDVPAVRLLLKIDVDRQTNLIGKGKALFHAAGAGKSSVIDVLISSGYNINEHDTDGATALIYAAKGGHLDTVKELVKLGADPNLSNRGYTPLQAAKDFIQDDIVAYLHSIHCK